MKSELMTRLKELKEEYKKGQERLMTLEKETTNLSNTMLRISGAIQVLEELIKEEAPPHSNDENTNLESAENFKK